MPSESGYRTLIPLPHMRQKHMALGSGPICCNKCTPCELYPTSPFTLTSDNQSWLLPPTSTTTIQYPISTASRSVQCGGITLKKLPCRRSKRLPGAQAQFGWFCHDHTNQALTPSPLPARNPDMRKTMTTLVVEVPVPHGDPSPLPARNPDAGITVSTLAMVPVPCGGITQKGLPCKRSKTLPAAQAKAGWFCHDHTDQASSPRSAPNLDVNSVRVAASTSPTDALVLCGGTTKQMRPCKRAKRLPIAKVQDGWYCHDHMNRHPAQRSIAWDKLDMNGELPFVGY